MHNTCTCNNNVSMFDDPLPVQSYHHTCHVHIFIECGLYYILSTIVRVHTCISIYCDYMIAHD